MACISMPYTTIGNDKTHVRWCCDRQRLVLPGLHVPDANSIVQGAGEDEAGVRREFEGEDDVFVTLKCGEDAVGRNVPYLAVDGICASCEG
jgi:hypothetical protein